MKCKLIINQLQPQLIEQPNYQLQPPLKPLPPLPPHLLEYSLQIYTFPILFQIR